MNNTKYLLNKNTFTLQHIHLFNVDTCYIYTNKKLRSYVLLKNIII